MQEYSYSYTKHIYAGMQRIASKVGDIEAFGADPRRVEYAGANLKEVDFGSKYEQQTKALLARYDSLGVEHRPNTLNDYVGGQSFCCGEKEFEPSQTGKDEFENVDYEEHTYFYILDHLGSASMVLDIDGNISQSVSYIPYGEIFVEDHNGAWNTPYLFNSKELDEETGFYYYGARYLNPTNGMWLSADPLFEKYVGMSPYNYCAGNPVKLVDVDGREFDEINEQIAQKIESQIDAKMAELQSMKKQSSDEKERLNELQQSKFDIQNMRLKQGIKFQYKSSRDSDNPANGGPTIEGIGSSLVTMYVDDDMGSVLHESRHGGDVARGKLSYENYGVIHEVSAYKAQYSWNGNLEFIDNPSQDVMIKRMYNNQPLNQCIICNYNLIDSNMIKNIHYVENGIPKSLYPPSGIDKETFYNR